MNKQQVLLVWQWGHKRGKPNRWQKFPYQYKIIWLSIAVFGILLISMGGFPKTSLANQDLGKPGEPDIVSGIVLAAGDVFDLEWDPSQYPGSSDEVFERWELKRSTDGTNYSVVTSGTTTLDDFYRDEDISLSNPKYYYRLEIKRCVSPCTEPEHHKTYTVFTDSANSGEVWGTVKKNLNLSTGDFKLTGSVTVPSAVKLTIEDGTNLIGPTSTPKRYIRANGGVLNIAGGTFKNHIIVQFGDPLDPLSTGGGGVNWATFSTGVEDPNIEIHGTSRQFNILNSSGVILKVWDDSSVNIKKLTNSSIYLYDASKANITESEVSAYLSQKSFALLTKNSKTYISLQDNSEAKIEENISPDNMIWMHDQTNATITDNELTNIILEGQATAEILDNRSIEHIEVNESASAMIEGNKISPSGIKVSGYGAPVEEKASAVIIGNEITSPYQHNGVDITYGAQAEISNNEIKWTGFHGSESSVLISVSDEDSSLTATRNLIMNGKIAVYWGSAITLTENVLAEPGAAITIGCIFCGTGIQATGTIERNTIQNGWGFEMYAGSHELTIRHNCIRSNDPGLTTDDARLSQPVNMKNNWWGHISGPEHPTKNPDGKGDRIIGNQVEFDPWDKSDQYCRDAPLPPNPDLRFIDAEAVQVIQDLNNSVPLVANKETFIHAYPENPNGIVPNVPWEMRVYRDSNLIGTRSGQITVRPVNLIDNVRKDKWKGIFVQLDAAWTTGEIEVEIELKAIPGMDEVTYKNNTTRLTLSFIERRKLRVGYIPIKYQPPGATTGTLPVIGSFVFFNEYQQAIMPLPEVEMKVLPALLWTKKMAGAGETKEAENAQKLLSQLNTWIIFWNEFHPPDRQLDQIVGIFPDLTNKAISYCISDPRWYFKGVRTGLGLASYCGGNEDSIAHEIGHNFGLRHANTTDAGLPGPEDSYWDDVYPDATIQEYGYHIIVNAIVPKTFFDFMSYKDPSWISPLHYTKLFHANGIPQSQTATSTIEQPYLVVAGTVNKSGEVTFEPVWQVTAETPPANPPEGTSYCLDLRDSGSAVLDSVCFDLNFYNFEAFLEVDTDTFMVSLPDNSATSSIVLRKGSTDLGEISISPSSPSVTLLEPNGGESLTGSTVIRWTSQDADGDPLTYALFYSNDDGTTWQPATLNITNTTSYTLDLSLLPGSTVSRIQIRASDGYHNASDESDGSFTVLDNPPLVGITSPEDQSTFLASDDLWGYAYDPEDGELEGTNLSWTSDQDGALGTGNLIQNAELSEGQHLITLTAMDSQGNVGSHTVTITVVPVLEIYLPLVSQ